MARYAAGDNSVFSEVYDAVGPVIFDQMLTLTEDSALAEERVAAPPPIALVCRP
jgi:hypothetical protein